MQSRTKFFAFYLVVVFLVKIGCSQVEAFVTPAASHIQQRVSAQLLSTLAKRNTQLQERKWNFNEGQGPFGLKKNAEVWNGRVAQMAFVFVFIQELIQGKGVIDGIKEGDPVNVTGLGLFALTILGFAGFLALKGPNNYVDEELKKMGEK